MHPRQPPVGPKPGNLVISVHRPESAARKSNDVNGTAQSPHRLMAGRQAARTCGAPLFVAQRILYLAARPRTFITDGDAAARPFERHREENEPSSRDRQSSTPLPHHVVMTSVANEQPTPMPYTCIRPLVARQLALPAWFFSPP